MASITMQVGKYIESTGYEPGVSGFRIDGEGNFEANNGIFRGEVASTLFSGLVALFTGTLNVGSALNADRAQIVHDVMALLDDLGNIVAAVGRDDDDMIVESQTGQVIVRSLEGSVNVKGAPGVVIENTDGSRFLEVGADYLNLGVPTASSAGSASGLYLPVRVEGTPYVIQLLTPAD